MLSTINRKAGLPPESLIYTGKRTSTEIFIDVIRYNAESFEEVSYETMGTLEAGSFYWIDIRGTNNPATIAEIGNRFGIDPLFLEDILDSEQRPKLEQSEKAIFLILKNLIPGNNGKGFMGEQICLYLTENLLITFEEYPDDSFRNIKSRMQQPTSRIRARRPDYLMYNVIDLITDHYFSVLDMCSDRITTLENEINEEPDLHLKTNIYHIRQDIATMKRIVLPTRESVSLMHRTESTLVTEKTKRYLRDVLDNIMQILDINDNHGDHLASLYDLFVSEMNFRMTNVMKILTVVTSIFIPLTFITSIYGMNFKYMPELNQPWAYQFVWLVMILLTILAVIYFKRKKWL